MDETWEEAVLTVLRTRPGKEWCLQDIYTGVEKRAIVTPHHRLPWGHQPNFHHWVRSTLAKLKREGQVVHAGPALYRLP